MTLSAEIFIAIQILMDLFLVILVIYLLKTVKTGMQQEASTQATNEVFAMIEPLLTEAEQTAGAFDRQIKEKHQAIQRINETLDARIISLNLLLNRAGDAGLQGFDGSSEEDPQSVFEQQKKILGLHKKGTSPAAIARRLEIPKGEVELVINLKKRFMQEV
ncbi:MAG: hypothetical protein SWH61_16260 [Thermodesulfobacteriota bacterium]|nr:hypothetical protein [Thermodesulfobacteriota bacterium]